MMLLSRSLSQLKKIYIFNDWHLLLITFDDTPHEVTNRSEKKQTEENDIKK